MRVRACVRADESSKEEVIRVTGKFNVVRRTRRDHAWVYAAYNSRWLRSEIGHGKSFSSSGKREACEKTEYVRLKYVAF